MSTQNALAALRKKVKNHTIMRSVNARLRIVGRIKNINTYIEYTRQKEYYRLKRKYRRICAEDRRKTAGVRSDYIFTCWLQGEQAAPPLVQACFKAMRAVPGKTVVVIDEDNVHEYVELPAHIVEKRRKQLISNAHYTDILRTALLLKHGGVWMDSTLLFTGKEFPAYTQRSGLFMFQSVHLIRNDGQYMLPSSWLIFAESDNRLLRLVWELLCAYWQDNNHLRHYLTYHLFVTLAAQRFPEDWKEMPVYSNQPCHVLQFELKEPFSEERWQEILDMTDFHKLNWRAGGSENVSSFFDYVCRRQPDGASI